MAKASEKHCKWPKLSVAKAIRLPYKREIEPMRKELNRSSVFKLLSFLIPGAFLVTTDSVFALETEQKPSGWSLSIRETEKSSILAQRPNPNQDRFLSPGQDLPTPIPEEDEPGLSEPVEPEAESPDAEPIETETPFRVLVEAIEVIGNTVLDPAKLADITQPLEGKEISTDELQQVVSDITQLYLSQGYVTSRAVLLEQEIADGKITIQMVEGELGNIEILGLERLRSGYVRSRLARGTAGPVNVIRIEEQLRLLRADPLLESIRGRLQPSTDGSTAPVLRVETEEAPSWQVGLSVDNYSAPSIGSERMGVSLAYQNLTGFGDTLSTDYYRSTTGGSEIWDLGYRLPVNSMDGAVSLRAVFDTNEVTRGPLAGEIDGQVDRYEVSFRQPLIRNLREEFALSAGFSHRDGQTFLGEVPFGFGIGPDPDTGISRTSVFKFGQDYLRRDSKGAWSLRSQFSLGTGLLDATTNEGAIPDGQFLSWLGQVQRVQRLGKDNLLIIRGDLQLSPDNLLSSEQFVIGGGQSLRGYRQNVRAGDNGFRVSVEDRITLTRDNEDGGDGEPVLQLAPFLDAGAIWNNGDNPNQLGDENFLVGAGVGLLYELVDGANMRLDYAVPLVGISDEGDNAQDEGFYFTVNYQY